MVEANQPKLVSGLAHNPLESLKGTITQFLDLEQQHFTFALLIDIATEHTLASALNSHPYVWISVR